jgi:tripartite-type tricarboxylate transporter receptor subunit TctC
VESNRMSQVSRLISIAVLGLLGLAVQATAETYPERVVRIVNPYPPGGSVDVMARILAQKLTDNLGQQVIVENRSGGGGNTGSDFVAKAEPDGYTLLFTAPGPLTVKERQIAYACERQHTFVLTNGAEGGYLWAKL